jgi:endonuclease/exonuclease/phosphatase family metal-dependent hydrolase
MRLRILTLNVLNLEGDPRRQEILNAELRRLDPDLLSFQEVVRDDEHDQLAQLLEGTNLHGTHQSEVIPYELPYSGRYGAGAIATRWPHKIVETLDFRDRPGKLHPWSTLAAVVEIPDLGELLFIGTTLTASADGAADHEREVVALTDLDARHRRNLPTIMAGDFNTRPEASAIRYLTGLQSLAGKSVLYHDAWAVAGDGPGHTWAVDNPDANYLIERIIRQPNLRWRIDYVFVGSAVAHPEGSCRIESAKLAFNAPVDGTWPSDHLGVLVEAEIDKHDLSEWSGNYPGSWAD